MALVLHHKVTSLPVTPLANSVYWVKNGAGYDCYVTDSFGVAVAMNAPAAGAPVTNMGTWNLPSFDDSLYPLATWQPPGNATTVPGVTGMAALTAIVAGVARNVAATNALTRMRRLGYATTAVAGNVNGVRQPAAQLTLGVGADNAGGFVYTQLFGCSDAATVATAKEFIGLQGSVAAPTNVEPSTLTNCIGVGHNSTDTNLQIYSGGSAAQARIDLGANFPAKTLSADGYQLTLYAPKDAVAAGYKIAYHVKRLGTAFSASGTLNGTLGTQLPANTTFLAARAWRTNGATALAAALDVGAMTIRQLY